MSETSVHSLKTVRDQNIVMSFSLSPNETKVFNTSNLENPLYTLPTLSGEFNNAGDRIVGVKAPGKVAVYDVKTGQELIVSHAIVTNETSANPLTEPRRHIVQQNVGPVIPVLQSR